MRNDITMNEIAELTGKTRQTIYNYFKLFNDGEKEKLNPEMLKVIQMYETLCPKNEIVKYCYEHFKNAETFDSINELIDLILTNQEHIDSKYLVKLIRNHINNDIKDEQLKQLFLFIQSLRNKCDELEGKNCESLLMQEEIQRYLEIKKQCFEEDIYNLCKTDFAVKVLNDAQYKYKYRKNGLDLVSIFLFEDINKINSIQKEYEKYIKLISISPIERNVVPIICGLGAATLTILGTYTAYKSVCLQEGNRTKPDACDISHGLKEIGNGSEANGVFNVATVGGSIGMGCGSIAASVSVEWMKNRENPILAVRRLAAILTRFSEFGKNAPLIEIVKYGNELKKESETMLTDYSKNNSKNAVSSLSKVIQKYNREIDRIIKNVKK